MKQNCRHPSHYGSDSKENPIIWRDSPKGQNGYCPLCKLIVVNAGLKIQKDGKFVEVKNKGHNQEAGE